MLGRMLRFHAQALLLEGQRKGGGVDRSVAMLLGRGCEMERRVAECREDEGG